MSSRFLSKVVRSCSDVSGYFGSNLYSYNQLLLYVDQTMYERRKSRKLCDVPSNDADVVADDDLREETEW